MHRYLLLLLVITTISACDQKKSAVVFQSDFGLKDGAVSEMKAIAYGVDSKLPLYDLTHEIPAYNTWEAAYRLHQTAEYWPRGTVFVSVVDPGVGTERKSVVMLSKTGHYFVSPDNGTLQFVAASLGIEQVREIDEKINRRNNSNASYTFHGRDVYAYTAARLASGTINFEQVGKLLPDSVVSFPFQKPVMLGDSILGNIPVLDPQYGNIWTNIPDSLFRKLNVRTGDKVIVNILKDSAIVYSGKIALVHTFGEVPRGTALAYMNSLMNFSLALNEASFSDSFKISSGPQWNVHITR
ncbi:MAG TPA: S-adenosyl-l-methionine hydroxide adenosyltransferase family protein [Flavitalea sp.]|nr:S-adenosyl-l-methionine hydroxide adenosyltransferase family protein [Flavitalea sp.]